MVAGNGPIRHLEVPVDVRESMANGGGPACLRLRVVADPADVDIRFMATDENLSAIADVVTQHWPARIHTDDLANPELAARVRAARTALLEKLNLDELG